MAESDDTQERATLGKITRTNGVAGQFQLSTTLTYPNGDSLPIGFVSSTYGGPIMIVTPDFPDGFRVDEPTRFGGDGLTPEWVSAFIGGTCWSEA